MGIDTRTPEPTATGQRFIPLRRVETEVYRVAYTWRGEKVIRIITAQKARKHEREAYREIFT
jgi:uncharacterized protein